MAHWPMVAYRPMCHVTMSRATMRTLVDVYGSAVTILGSWLSAHQAPESLVQKWRRFQRSAKTSDIEHPAAPCEICVTKKHRTAFPFQWRADRHEIFHAAKPRRLSLRVAHIRQARREPPSQRLPLSTRASTARIMCSERDASELYCTQYG